MKLSQFIQYLGVIFVFAKISFIVFDSLWWVATRLQLTQLQIGFIELRLYLYRLQIPPFGLSYLTLSPACIPKAVIGLMMMRVESHGLATPLSSFIKFTYLIVGECHSTRNSKIRLTFWIAIKEVFNSHIVLTLLHVRVAEGVVNSSIIGTTFQQFFQEMNLMTNIVAH